QRRRPRAPARGARVPGEPLRDAGRAARPRDGDDPGRAWRAAGLPEGAQPLARGTAPGAADAVRPRDAARARLLPRHRELFTTPHGTAPGRAASGPHRVS